MFRSHDMKKVTLFGLNKDRDAILTAVHKLGMLQPTDLKARDVSEELKRPELLQEISEISDKLLRVSRVVSVLKLAPRKLTLPQTMFGFDIMDKKNIQRKSKKDILLESETFFKKNESEIIKLEEKYNNLTEQHEELSDLKKIILIFDKVGKPLHMFKDSENISIITGRIPTINISRLRKDLEKETEDYSELTTKKESKKESIATIISLKSYASKINFLAKKHGMNVFTFPDLPKEENLKAWVNSKLKENKSEQEKIIKKISVLQKKLFSDSVALKEELDLLKERYEVLHNMLDSHNFFILQAWVIEKDLAKIETALNDITKGKIVIKSDEPTKEEQEQVPVQLDNPKWLKPFEMLTELYALPKYKDLDPTFIVGPIFVIYAAFMLTDAVYGFALLILGIFIFKKFAKYNEGLKYAMVNLIVMGTFCTFFGILTGSYFGDLPIYLFGLEKAPALWRDPLADPLYFLIISIGVAVVHLNFGLILGVIEDVRKKAWKDLLKERLVWFFIQIGVLLMALKVPLGKWVFGLTVLLIVVLSGPLGLLSITGLMGDMISYSRLFALALSTSGIALAVNLLANLVLDIPGVGIVAAILIFIIGHLFGFVMNTIGAFVHSLRLQFVEFFGRFYEGGGDRFQPLKEERVYTEVKE